MIEEIKVNKSITGLFIFTNIILLITLVIILGNGFTYFNISKILYGYSSWSSIYTPYSFIFNTGILTSLILYIIYFKHKIKSSKKYLYPLITTTLELFLILYVIISEIGYSDGEGAGGFLIIFSIPVYLHLLLASIIIGIAADKRDLKKNNYNFVEVTKFRLTLHIILCVCFINIFYTLILAPFIYKEPLNSLDDLNIFIKKIEYIYATQNLEYNTNIVNDIDLSTTLLLNNNKYLIPTYVYVDVDKDNQIYISMKFKNVNSLFIKDYESNILDYESNVYP